MGRHLEFEPGDALQKAMLVFWRLGYERSSIQALETATGIGRKSLYRAFTDKHDLFLKSLGAYRAMMAEENLAPLVAPDAGIGTIEALFDKFVGLAGTEMAGMGCLICNTAMERGADDPEAARHVQGYFDQIRSAMRNALARAAERGEIALGPEALDREANVLLGAVQSLCVLGRAGTDPETMRDVARAATERLR
jgi:TetR/AcrR family transcriptional repressor of nem operon